MKVLQIHNFYQNPGGEDQVFAAERDLLASRGHNVIQHLAHNDAIRDMPGLQVSLKTFWNAESYREVRTLICRERPDVVHAHNTFPLVSPSIYYAAAAEGVPIVQTLHNYRLLCPGGAFFREGRVCEECMGSLVPYKAAVHGCYRNSRAASTVLAGMLTGHRLMGTWRQKVDKYIAITEFSKAKFVAGGLPGEKIAVKPNFLAQDPRIGDGRGGFALFAGRLSEEKGVTVLLEAWRNIGRVMPLKIAGDGPLREKVRELVSSLPGVEWLGFSSHDVVMRLLGEAAFLVLPSTCYEHLSMTLVEALACGTPVLASALGTMKESVIEGVNGYHFKPGDASDLSSRVNELVSKPWKLQEMRRSARLSYEKNYTAATNYISLMNIYKSVILDYKKS
jgi:glycosyltransferase involved in cell wall biosynthesis